jgi:PST family polysaccharide transporter
MTKGKYRETSMRKALAAQFTSKYLYILIQLALTAILARLLTPKQFGLVATVTIFTAFFAMLSDLGIAPAIVQFRDLMKRELSGLITFTFLLGLLLTTAFWLISTPIGMFYGNNDLVELCRWASPGILFSAIGMVPNGLLLREKQFVTIGVRLIASTAFAGVLAIFLALHGFGAYSLIAFNVAASAVTSLWSLAAARIPIGNIHFVEPLRKIISYAGFQAGFGFVNYFSRNLDNFVIGKVLGMQPLGYYDKAYKLTSYPLSFLASIIGSVLQPYLAESQDYLPYIFRQWRKTAKILSLLGAPITVVLIVCAPEITTILYGTQWALSIPILQILGISAYFQIVNNPTGAIFQSTNRTDLLFAHSLVATSLTVVGLAIGIALGNLTAVSWGIAIAYCLHTLSIAYFLIWKVFHENIWSYFQFFAPELISGTLIGVSGLLLANVISLSVWPELALKLLFIALLFVVAYTFSGQWKYFPRVKKESRSK